MECCAWSPSQLLLTTHKFKMFFFYFQELWSTHVVSRRICTRIIRCCNLLRFSRGKQRSILLNKNRYTSQGHINLIQSIIQAVIQFRLFQTSGLSRWRSCKLHKLKITMDLGNRIVIQSVLVLYLCRGSVLWDDCWTLPIRGALHRSKSSSGIMINQESIVKHLYPSNRITPYVVSQSTLVDYS